MNQTLVRKGPQSSRKHFAPLEVLPPSFRVPADLQDRFGYDEKRKGLTFEGWMCKATFDRLRNLSSDYHYQRALERLFQIAVPEEESAPRHHFGLMFAAGAALMALLAVCGFLLRHR